jgi:ABC-type bacteriocin/lantibiotic exporter with double-glycine peptidase domain
MKRNRFLHVLKVLAIVAIAVTVISFVTMHLWNWVMPAVFGLRTITWLQALALLVLGKILFGGIHRHGGGFRGRRWKQHLAERWMQMTPEEREQLRAGLRGRWGCGFDRGSEPAAEKTR